MPGIIKFLVMSICKTMIPEFVRHIHLIILATLHEEKILETER